MKKNFYEVSVFQLYTGISWIEKMDYSIFAVDIETRPSFMAYSVFLNILVAQAPIDKT